MMTEEDQQKAAAQMSKLIDASVTLFEKIAEIAKKAHDGTATEKYATVLKLIVLQLKKIREKSFDLILILPQKEHEINARFLNQIEGAQETAKNIIDRINSTKKT